MRMELSGRIENVSIGDSEKVTRKIRAEDLAKFADAIDSHHPLHMDPEWAKIHGAYEERVIHGVMTAALVSRPTVNFLQRHRIDSVSTFHSSKYIAPVRVGDVVTHTLIVKSIDLQRRRIVFSVEVTNQNGTLVMVGEAHEMIL